MNSPLARALDWERDAQDWPNREASRFVHAAGLRWHVQHFIPSDRPRSRIVLLHGTGASTHSWRALAPLLAQHHEVICPDLPGHAFSAMPRAGPLSSQLTLPGMARAISSLLERVDATYTPNVGALPVVLVGHSAGAAIAAQMSIDGLTDATSLISINGAFLPLGGFPGRVFSPVAKVLAVAPLIPQLFSWRAGNPAVLQSLLAGTGSKLDARGRELYGRLIRSSGHAGAALAMMANWDLRPLERRLGGLNVELDLVAGEADRTIDPAQANAVANRTSKRSVVRIHVLPGLGHLAHEERPDLILEIIENAILRLPSTEK